MAEDINKEVEMESRLSTLEKRTNDLLRERDELYAKSARTASQGVTEARSLTEELKDQIRLRGVTNEFDKSHLGLVRKINNSVIQNTTELRRQGKLYQQILKDESLTSATIQEAIALRKELSQEEIQRADQLINTSKKISSIEREILDIIEEGQVADEKRLGTLEVSLKEKENELAVLSEQRKSIADSLQADTKRYATLLEIAELQKQNLQNKKEELVLEDKINSAIGITGAVLDNVKRIGFRAFGGLGVNLATFGAELTKAKEAADEMGEVLETSEEQSIRTLSQFDKKVLTLQAALPFIRKGIKDLANDPLVAIGIAVKLFEKFRQLEQTRTEMDRLGGSAARVAIESSATVDSLTTFTQIAKIATGITQQLGVNVGLAFSKENLQGAALLENYLGLSSEEAGNLAILSQTFGTNLNENKNSLIAGVNSFNAMNKAAVSHSTIIRDVASTSKAVAASLEGNPERLAKAAAAARNLGIQLNELDNIASSLLDFESSIESELEAQLVTGKNINLTKARELALSNDLEGVGRELFNNSASLFEFGRMNRIQQESYAKALGLSREQLAGVAYQQAILQRLTGQALEDATGMTAAELERMSINERMLKIQEKLTEIAGKYGYIIGGVLLAYKALTGYATVLQSIDVIRTALATKRAKAEVTSAAASLLEAKADAVSSAAEAGKSVSKIPGIGGFLALGIISGIAGFLLGKLTSVQDGVIDSQGGLIVSGPKGSIQLDKDDSIIAGTNLAGAGTPNRSNEETNQLLKQLISETRKKQNIYLGHAYRLNEGLEVYS